MPPEPSPHSGRMWGSQDYIPMNWSKESPLEGVKYIVRTETQKLFPAFYEKGGWWHSEGQFEIFNVCTWILYPNRQVKNESQNSDVPVEVLMKYLVRDFKRMKEIAKGESEKVKELKKLNKSLVTEYNTLLMAHRELQKKSGQSAFIAEAKLEAKRVENRELNLKLEKLKGKSEGGNPERMEKLLKENEQLKEELKLIRKQARKGRTLHGNLRKLLEQTCMLEAVGENQTKKEIVA